MAFLRLKEALVSRLILQCSDWSKQTVLCTDASNISTGAAWMRKCDSTGLLLPIDYAGRAFNKAERNYEVTRQEMLAVVWAIKHFSCYLLGRKFKILITHAPLTGLIHKHDITGQLGHLVLTLQGCDFEIEHIRGCQNVVPDFLSRTSYSTNYTAADDEIYSFPDPHISTGATHSATPIPSQSCWQWKPVSQAHKPI